MRNNFRLCSAACLLYAASGLYAQVPDAPLALSTSVSYNTQRLSLKLSPGQAKEAAALGEAATAATRAGRFGEALDDYAHGIAVMHGVAWTPDVEFASALRPKLNHSITAPGEVTLTVAPFYPASRAASAKLSVTLVLVQGGTTFIPKTALDPAAMPFSQHFTIPSEAAGDYQIEVRLTEADGSAPEGLPNVFVRTLPIQVADYSGDLKRLRDGLAKVSASDNPAIASAQYTLSLYERADKGEVNLKAYDFHKEFTTAQGIVDAVAVGQDYFAGKHGDFRKAYVSRVDKTLQPYRLMIPAAYDAEKSLPMVVALHGMGGDENSMFDSYGRELPVDCDKAGFILVAPKGRGPASMYRGTAEQDVLDVMAEVERDYKVDKSRVYLMGHSMGGYGTWSIAMDHPQLFAALGPISGGGSAAGMEKIRNIPQYVTHGDDDRTVNVNSSRTMVEAGRKLGASITYVEVPGGSHVSVAQPAFAPMMEFFKRQTKTAAMSEK